MAALPRRSPDRPHQTDPCMSQDPSVIRSYEPLPTFSCEDQTLPAALREPRKEDIAMHVNSPAPPTRVLPHAAGGSGPAEGLRGQAFLPQPSHNRASVFSLERHSQSLVEPVGFGASRFTRLQRQGLSEALPSFHRCPPATAALSQEWQQWWQYHAADEIGTIKLMPAKEEQQH